MVNFLEGEYPVILTADLRLPHSCDEPSKVVNEPQAS